MQREHTKPRQARRGFVVAGGDVAGPELDGAWRVQREAGLLPPMFGVRKVVSGRHGYTVLGPIRAAFDVVGDQLRYRSPFRGFIDVLTSDGNEWSGRALFAGREYGRFRLTRA